MKCKHCGCEMEAEFVDIGIGSQQVTDWVCSNGNCPEYIEWLEKNCSKDIEGSEATNCKNCNWLCYYDGYFCGNGNAKTDGTAFIEDIEKDVCAEFKRREEKFWIDENGEF